MQQKRKVMLVTSQPGLKPDSSLKGLSKPASQLKRITVGRVASTSSLAHGRSNSRSQQLRDQSPTQAEELIINLKVLSKVNNQLGSR